MISTSKFNLRLISTNSIEDRSIGDWFQRIELKAVQMKIDVSEEN